MIGYHIHFTSTKFSTNKFVIKTFNKLFKNVEK